MKMEFKTSARQYSYFKSILWFQQKWHSLLQSFTEKHGRKKLASRVKHCSTALRWMLFQAQLLPNWQTGWISVTAQKKKKSIWLMCHLSVYSSGCPGMGNLPAKASTSSRISLIFIRYFSVWASASLNSFRVALGSISFWISSVNSMPRQKCTLSEILWQSAEKWEKK